MEAQSSRNWLYYYPVEYTLGISKVQSIFVRLLLSTANTIDDRSTSVNLMHSDSYPESYQWQSDGACYFEDHHIIHIIQSNVTGQKD